jgi:DNA-binding CsgD family transcriptional regulator
MIARAASALSPETVIRGLLKSYPFESLSYFVTRTVAGIVHGELVWTTLPSRFVGRYRRENFARVDPRLERTRGRIGPMLWDAHELAGNQERDRFLALAADYGLRSGVAIALTDGALNQVTVTFDSAAGPIGSAQRNALVAIAADLTLISIALHESVLKWRVANAIGTPGPAPALTLRERDCLALAARGMTSADIGNKLCVAERTVNFHFANIKTKLGAINRPEAIARGIAMGIVRCG